MHPWIRSEEPGRCTICGMELTPVYEGESGIELSGDRVTLGSNSLHVVDVQTSPAVRQALRRTIRGAGTLQQDATRQRVISAYVEGRLDRLFVNYDGAEVVAGEPLALLYSPMLLGTLREYLSLVRDFGPAARCRGRRPCDCSSSGCWRNRLPACRPPSRRQTCTWKFRRR